jgi:hypothetical protein
MKGLDMKKVPVGLNKEHLHIVPTFGGHLLTNHIELRVTGY